MLLSVLNRGGKSRRDSGVVRQETKPPTIGTTEGVSGIRSRMQGRMAIEGNGARGWARGRSAGVVRWAGGNRVHVFSGGASDFSVG